MTGMEKEPNLTPLDPESCQKLYDSINLSVFNSTMSA